MSHSFHDRLGKKILVLDGAMGSTLQAMDLTVEDYLGHENCVDLLCWSRPELVASVHASFLEVGADAVETNTFGANRLVLREFDDDVASRSHDLNVTAAQVARGACDQFATPDAPRFVLGSMGPGTRLISLGQVKWDEMLESYCEQAAGLLEGGVDALLIETCQDLLQVKCAVTACLDAIDAAGREIGDVPVMVNVTVETTGTMLMGSEIAAAAEALSMLPIASLGLNCATGPIEMSSHVAYLARHWDRPISVVPNAGLPIMVEGQTEFPLGPQPMVEALTRFVEEHGIAVIGGCCGTTPEHIGLLAAELGGRPVASREIEPVLPGCSSLYRRVDFTQDSSFLIVAERTNANGSRKFKRLLEEEDWDGLVGMAREELRGGSHVLDVCVDFVGRDGVRDMEEVVGRFVQTIDAPIMVDSTEADVIEAALKMAGGKCIVNSINLEDGPRRLDEICPMLRRYGAACIALTIDEDPQAGMAKTAARKLEIATRLHDLYTKTWGLDDADLLIDPLTFTIATGMESDRRLAAETLDGIALIAEALPRCGILLGLSNVSFGLKPAARAVLNSVFLQQAMERGLTAAIVHASKILPRKDIADDRWEAAMWLIHDHRGDDRPEGMDEDFDPLHYFIELFPDGEEAVKEEREPRTLQERLQFHIIDGDDTDLDVSLTEAMEEWPPLEIINDHLLSGMKVVGELFADGRMQLPFVLQSASVMKKAVSFLEPHMERGDAEASRKGTIVLATVAGDVHDIGKNLVDIILSNNGFDVINIGIKQHISAIVDAAKTHGADAIGMSGLLVKSVRVMEDNLRELNAQGNTTPILVGGAALTRFYAESHMRDSYEGSLYYGKDAFEALRICGHLAEGTLDAVDVEIKQRVAKRIAVQERVATMVGPGGAKISEDEEPTPVEEVEIPEPPFLGHRIAESIDLKEIFPYLNPNALFRGQWGFRRGSMTDVEYAAFIAETVEPVLARMKSMVIDEDIFRPQVAWGYFPCASEGEDLIIYDPDDRTRETERFTFPRQNRGARRCISDFFRPLDSGARDIIGMSCVTIGPEASRRAAQLFEQTNYTDYLYLHGLGVETAEALAELWHKRMRMELGISGDDAADVTGLFRQGYRGSRYSFGYPACPEMADQEQLFRLLEPERIGLKLTDNFQIDPEQSTTAIIVHHPEARYFNV
jgi:5-methyltetrahydrofolate--homocysteine methyltransferase